MHERAFYDEAALRYAQRVQSRATAIYRLDRTEASLHGVRMLVVVDRTSLDNRYFFSPQERLPEPLAHAFERDPFIVPAFAQRVMRHAPCENRSLICGRDVLLPYGRTNDADERLCRELEQRCMQLPPESAELPLLQAALCGDISYDGLSRDYAYRREREIAGYRHDLASLGFPYGDMFSRVAHPNAVAYAPAPRIVEQFVHNYYALRRRIESYA